MELENKNQQLAPQTCAFRDATGPIAEHSPVAQLIFTADDDAKFEEAMAGDIGNWDVASYPESQSRALLTQAQTYARCPTAE